MSTLNRFLSADSIIPDPTNPQQYNRYSYVLNSPLNFRDPTGHVCTEVGNNMICSKDDDREVVLPPPPSNHRGNDKTVIPGFDLTEDEILLLTLGVFAENQNASHPAFAMELWTWVFLNKKARNPETSLYNIINTSSGAWNVPTFVRGWEPTLGSPAFRDPELHQEWLLEAANGYMNGDSDNAKNFQTLYALIAGPDTQSLDGGFYDEWRIHGTNSSQDPTNGAVFAVHRDSGRFVNELGPLLADYAEINSNFSYAFSRAYLGMITLVGNHGCIYDHDLCQ